MAIKSLYIHIPFCKHICYFCDFTKLLVNDKFVFPYMAKIFNDLDFLASCGEKYDTIYIGGGTPTSLGDDYFEHLLKACRLLLNDDGEFTCEANVENLTRNKLILMEKNGVNRLSVGIQTFDDNLLKDIHRHHCADESIENIKLAKLFIKNINCDFIYGLPNQSLKILKDDVKKALELKVTHLSFYSLTINKGTEFFNRGIKEINQDESREFYDYILKKLTKAGYVRYEVSNFAKPGFECKHNINYWNDGEYKAIGLGASGYENGVRYRFSASLPQYLKYEEKDDIEVVTKKEDEEFFLMLQLRKKEGFLIEEFNKRFDTDFLKKYNKSLTELKKNRLIEEEDGRVRATDEGLIILDSILLALYKDEDSKI